MSDKDILKRRLRKPIQDAADIAEETAEERNLPKPGPEVYQMGLKLFDARMALLFRDPDSYDLPDDSGRESW